MHPADNWVTHLYRPIQSPLSSEVSWGPVWSRVDMNSSWLKGRIWGGVWAQKQYQTADIYVKKPHTIHFLFTFHGVTDLCRGIRLAMYRSWQTRNRVNGTHCRVRAPPLRLDNLEESSRRHHYCFRTIRNQDGLLTSYCLYLCHMIFMPLPLRRSAGLSYSFLWEKLTWSQIRANSLISYTSR